MAASGAERQPGGLTPEQWRKVGEVFHGALDTAAEERTAWLDRQCAGDDSVRREVLSLLENDRAASQGSIEKRVKSAVVSFYQGDESGRAGQRVGHYRLVREIGRGGMGSVFLAERDDEQYKSRVAIKLVRRGMDTEFILKRFRRERQILAQLQHPNIAALLDGGTTDDGLPYFVMEHVEGTKVTEYCDAHDLTIRQRVELFLHVCAAVEYAHSQFVVHRDLKPGNILVDAGGRPKLLDFGVCKVLQSRAGSGETVDFSVRMLTPEYASPEQILGDPITVGSDIYSLAAVLYELLTAAKPHRLEKLTPMAIERVICEEDVIRPSAAAKTKALARRIAGDLDTILLRALEKDPRQRYASVEQFSEDLRRHLTHQPVRARSNTLVYRARKFLRRQRTAVAAFTAVIATLAAGITVSLREAKTARDNLLEVHRLASIFVFDAYDAIRDLPGSTRARQLIVATGLRNLDQLARTSRGNPALIAELAGAYRRIGDVQGDPMSANLGNMKGALDSYRKAMSLLDSLRDPADPKLQLDRMTLLQKIGGVYSYTEDTRQALTSYRDAEKLGELLLPSNAGNVQVPIQVASIYMASAEALRLQGEYAESQKSNLRALNLLLDSGEAHPGDRVLDQSLAAAYSAAGVSEVRLGNLKEGLERYRRALTLLDRLTKVEPANLTYQHELMQAYTHLGDVLGNPNLKSLGDTPGAIDAYRQMVAMARHLHEADPADQRAASDYANALARMAAVTAPLDERIAMLRESLRLLDGVRLVSPRNTINQWDIAHEHGLLGDLLVESGDREGAVRSYHESVSVSEALLTAGVTSPVPTLMSSCQKLAEDSAAHGDRTLALAYSRRVLELSRAAGAKKLLVPNGATAMGLVYAQLGDREQANTWLQQSLAEWRQAQTDPNFGPQQSRAMQRVESALKEMKRRK
jgi:tetratricopeptide (TPR) repeat protein/tRNA A-37 threonylcarbamoyl transferase component Bud32